MIIRYKENVICSVSVHSEAPFSFRSRNATICMTWKVCPKYNKVDIKKCIISSLSEISKIQMQGDKELSDSCGKEVQYFSCKRMCPGDKIKNFSVAIVFHTEIC